MPTTEPLDPGDDVGGPLKPIAAFSAPAAPRQPAAPVRPAANASTPATNAAMATATAAYASAPSAQRAGAQTPSQTPTQTVHAARPGLRTTIGVPGLSLHSHTARTQQTASARPQEAAPQGPRNSFSDTDVDNAWTAFIEAHGTEQLLINTMRGHVPTREGERLTVTVENDIQHNLIEEAAPAITDHLRKALANYAVTLTVVTDEDTSSPRTWNEREVLADIIRRHPDVSAFVTALGLSLD